MIGKNCGNCLKLIKEIQHPLQHFTLIDKPSFTKKFFTSKILPRMILKLFKSSSVIQQSEKDTLADVW
jgi:hypothetical protein